MKSYSSTFLGEFNTAEVYCCQKDHYPILHMDRFGELHEFSPCLSRWQHSWQNQVTSWLEEQKHAHMHINHTWIKGSLHVQHKLSSGSGDIPAAVASVFPTLNLVPVESYKLDPGFLTTSVNMTICPSLTIFLYARQWQTKRMQQTIRHHTHVTGASCEEHHVLWMSWNTESSRGKFTERRKPMILWNKTVPEDSGQWRHCQREGF